MDRHHIVAASIVGGLALLGSARAADPLPHSLSGSWYGASQGGKPMNFEVQLAVEKVSPDGSVEGKLTRWGNGCGAKDEPFKGTYDGTTFRFTSMSQANVNAARRDGNCGMDEYILTRSADGKVFDGKFGDVGAPRFNVTLKP
ncbi:MAG TPA: hypothetical protein VMN56_04430 [Casimicrobiaceae bacterium]|nr:hypothetical protein [Casimicrobiaceae bacterium]